MKLKLLLLFVTLFTHLKGQQSKNSQSKTFPYAPEEKTTQYWFKQNRKWLEESIVRTPNTEKAKNVILFLGDGMSLSTLTASRMLKGQLNNRAGEEGNLFMETFPYFSLIKTFNVDRQTPDSAGTASAFLTGVKANYGVIGYNANVFKGDANCTHSAASSVTSIIKWSIDSGKVAGIVTTTRITHATPAAAYSHISSRDWEADWQLPNNSVNCKDIARQLIEDDPGRNINVILGGGWRYFYPNNSSSSDERGDRRDGRNLVNEWIKSKQAAGLNDTQYKFVNTSGTLQEAIDTPSVTSIFGLFNVSHLSYEADRQKGSDGEPSLTQMVAAAVATLKRADKGKGWILFVEGGRIDHAHHENKANMALRETLQFDEAIEKAVSMVNLDETLVMVTADHSHTLTINGYASRGTRIDGGLFVYANSGKDKSNVTYPVLMYGNGPGHQFNEKFNFTGSNDIHTSTHSAVYATLSAHGGEDVGCYATGPWSHIFSGLKDQTFIPHVAAFASCVGHFKHAIHCGFEEGLMSGSISKPSVSTFAASPPSLSPKSVANSVIRLTADSVMSSENIIPSPITSSTPSSAMSSDASSVQSPSNSSVPSSSPSSVANSSGGSVRGSTENTIPSSSRSSVPSYCPRPEPCVCPRPEPCSCVCPSPEPCLCPRPQPCSVVFDPRVSTNRPCAAIGERSQVTAEPSVRTTKPNRSTSRSQIGLTETHLTTRKHSSDPRWDFLPSSPNEYPSDPEYPSSTVGSVMIPI